MGRQLREFLADANDQKKQKALDFIQKYKPLMTEGNMDNFDFGEQPMELQEALNTKDASVLMTTIMEEAMQEAAEPMYVAENFFDTVQIDQGNRLIFPAIDYTCGLVA